MLPLLDPTEPAAFEVVNAAGKSDLVLVCDHASNRIPQQLQALGLAAQELETHIAWDPGALLVARSLSDNLDAPLVSSGYSRLVIDCNRHPENPDSIPASSAGIAVPGNLGLSAQAIMERRQELFYPYHDAIDRLLQMRKNRPTFLLSIHSFTPVLNGIERPWQIGVCYGDEKTIAKRWLQALKTGPGVRVGDNQPFSIEEDVDFTIPNIVHNHGIPAIMLEIRHDEIATQASAATWSEIIGKAWLRYLQ